MNENSNKYGDGKLRRGLGTRNGGEDRGRTVAVTIDGRSPSPSILIKLAYLFVCMYVCPQTTPREINKYR